MSGLANEFRKVIKKELEMHATWFPITDKFEVGDYGVINNGSFKRLGNLKKKYPNIPLEVEPGNSASINFTSEGVSSTKLNVDGSGINSFSELGNVQAKLRFTFNRDNSFVVKTSLSSMELKNIDEVATELAKQPSWNRNRKIISKVYNGEQSVVVLANEAGTEFELSATAEILAKVEGGKAEAGITTQFTKKNGLDMVGDTGALALQFFKIGGFNPGPVFLKAAGESTYEILTGDLEDDI